MKRDQSPTTPALSTVLPERHHRAGTRGDADGSAWLDEGLRRLGVYVHLQDLVAGRDVVEVWGGAPEPRAWQTLASRGARRVVVVAPAGTQTDAGGGDPRRGIVRAVGDARRTGLPIACADVLFALDLEATSVPEVVAEARRVLRPEGVLVLGLPSRDRPGATSGISYYDLVDACAARGGQRGFESVRMIGVAPFAGATLVEYGVQDPEPILDGTLVDRGERVAYYLAVAGPERSGDFGYGLVQLPLDALARETGRIAGAPPLAPSAAPAVVTPVSEVTAARFESNERDQRLIAELRTAIERHAVEMRAREVELAERDACIAELEFEGRRVHELEGRVTAAEARARDREAQAAEARRQIAQLEGSLRATEASGRPSQAPTRTGDGDEVAFLKQKLAEAEAQGWKQLKARSEAEAAAAELREDNMRKLKDAKKLASVELMRAMQEATKKAFSLREELDRSERDRKAAQAELAVAKSAALASALAAVPVAASPDLAAQRREVARAREEAEAVARAAQAQAARSLIELESARLAAEAAGQEAEARRSALDDRLRGLERALLSAERSRDETRAELATEQLRSAELAAGWRGLAGDGGSVAALSADAEQRASARGRELAEQERRVADQAAELVQLRGVLAERDRHIAVVDRERPPRIEVERQRDEAVVAKARLVELALELQRRDAALERAAAAAAHERARAERLVADERQALAERNDTRARAAEVAAEVAGLRSDRERASAAATAAEAHAHKAENEVKEKRERIRQLKRELEDAERRAEHVVSRTRALETVRARVLALETAVGDEVARVVALEVSLRRTAP